MSNAIYDGGPAFPPHAESTSDEYMGMTLRDYFAAKADISKDIEDDGCLMPRLAVSIMGGDPPSWDQEYLAARIWWAEAEAKLRFIKADAMIKARQS